MDILKKIDPKLIVEAIIEGFHNNLDGWDDEHDKEVIRRYVEDLIQYTSVAGVCPFCNNVDCTCTK